MNEKRKPSIHERWALLRFSVVGPLLAAPPARGELQGELEKLAAKSWLHPVTGEPTCFGRSTIERWLSAARKAQTDPMSVLRRKLRKDVGTQPSLGDALKSALLVQYAAHNSWSYQLHADNLAALVEADPKNGVMPSYDDGQAGAELAIDQTEWKSAQEVPSRAMEVGWPPRRSFRDAFDRAVELFHEGGGG